MRTVSRKPQEYKEDLKQNFIYNSYQSTYFDQYGFSIEYGTKYTLKWKDQLICKTFSLQAAKEISTILLNDKIMHDNKE